MSVEKFDKITAIKGMNDILPNKSYMWNWLEDKLKQWLSSYGYKNIRTPIIENTRLYTRSIGEVTDIVEKEMYTFTDKLNGDSLTLRPEGTAGTVRAVLEHNLLYKTTQKLWYIGQMFRHERPQKGRYRQFHQLGVEAFGFSAPSIDSEIILMLHDLWEILGLKQVQLHINCLGNHDERAKHREALIKYLEQHIELLDDDAKRRLYTNPLRILDTKVPALQGVVENAPRLIDFLSEESQGFHEEWKRQLTELNIPFIENPRLVRGLDYYNLSVFEWVDCSGGLGSQSTIAAGGRYDPLVAELGGSDNYEIGFAIGIERLLLILEELSLVPQPNFMDIYVVSMSENVNDYAFKVARLLRNSGLNVIQDFSYSSLKSQFKKADNEQVKVAVVIGENELNNNQVVVKLMDTGAQQLVNLSDLETAIHDLINKKE